MIYTHRFFSLQNAVCFIILTYLASVLFTFYIQGVLKLKKPGAKMLMSNIVVLEAVCFGRGPSDKQLFSPKFLYFIDVCTSTSTFL